MQVKMSLPYGDHVGDLSGVELETLIKILGKLRQIKGNAYDDSKPLMLAAAPPVLDMSIITRATAVYVAAETEES